MSEPQRNENASAPIVRQLGREIRWDAAAAIIASLVGLLALVVAGYTAYIQREQVRAQVWPFLMMASSDHSSEYMWLNKGVGPAHVESMQVFVGGKLQGNWRDVFRSMQLEKLKYGQSTMNGNVLSAGEKVDWLQFDNHEDFLAFREAARRSGFGVKTCYCSTLGECWINDSTKADWNAQHAVGKCPAMPETQQFDD
jgi:hypothetical protein